MTILRVRVGYSGIGGTPYLSTFFFNGAGQTDADNAASAVATFQGAIDAFQDSELTWRTDPQVVEINEANGQALGSYSTAAQTASGSVTGESVPFIAQALVRMRTGVYIAGRELRGRLFIPGLTEVNSTNGVLASATLTGLGIACDNLRTDADAEWVVWSRTHGQDSVITAANVWEQFATLRSRRPGF